MKTTCSSIVVFGATGDLMRRKLAPALFRLFQKGRLPPCAGIVGFAQTELDDDGFRRFVREALDEFVTEIPEADWATFAPLLRYVQGDLTAPESYLTLRKRLEELEGESFPRLYYLAIAPRFFPSVVDQLDKADLSSETDASRRLVIEKPFGRDGLSAGELNRAAHSVFKETQLYRIDHYLGKETAQNLIYLRFANTIFEPLWNRLYIDNVQISVSESVDVGHRADYYDGAGVLRDMFQNHLFQLFTLVAMEPPSPFNATTLRDEKVKVLAATRPLLTVDTVCGQYEGYRATEGVEPSSRTPTYAAMKLLVDSWRWQGVPFYLRSGKALGSKSSTITIEFKRPPHQMFGSFQSPTPNVLSICIQPDEGVHLQFDAKVPDQSAKTQPVDLEFHYQSAFERAELPEAYERLLLDALQGDASLFARSDEIEHAWKLLDPIIEAWDHPETGSLAHYAQGSDGPVDADELLAADGRAWHAGCVDH